ncbi:radical SAM protein [Phorcysia thermohydrogeniphila]|uniref:Radical SAM superfamily enzyme YgiQ (UPF0313 family) n=1 Tax=Phorcysia thermohydrogeniphila TaxID=936138 RepID=A0A4R1GKS0_9BACT|nr:radical SAM protein [Phorcysia thermohydrogeniphila]TCK06669.1 radical SAM superfamily enzyme YgiQ (UPF0313 family) [Phorcysia thermohydrogeniphila]
MSELLFIEECCHLNLRKDDLKVCLIYPGEERAGLSSLAVHRIYSILNGIEGVSCDLYFEDSEVSYFLGWELKDFDVIAVSITYEEHIFSLAKILSKAGIPPLREEREEGAPIIFGGGIGLFYNPTPFMPIFDAIYLGEAEGRIEEVFSKLKDTRNPKILREFDNVIFCQDYLFEYEGERVKRIEGEKKKIFRSPLFSLTFSHSCFISGDTAFKDMLLIELNRGCIEKCRFCIASYMGLPYREKSIEVIEKEIELASKYTDRVGLIGAGVTDYSRMGELYQILKKYGVKASFSSMKASSTSEYIFKIVEESGQKTVTLAPEAGTEELRFAINKKVPDERYFSFARKAFEHGAENIKLYFLIGLPGETDEDIEGIALMAKKFRELAMEFWRERGKAGEVILSVNPVVAKPFTPFQWYGQNSKSQVEKKFRFLSKLLRKIPGVKLSRESSKSYVLQSVVSRGDPRVGVAAVSSAVEGKNFRKALKEQGLDIESLYTRERDEEELFPWEIVESGINRKYLWREYRMALERKSTPTCFPGCKVCGICATLQKEKADV